MSSSTSFTITLVFKLTSGDESLIKFLSALESRASKWFSTKSLISFLFADPLIDTIWCFNRVVISGDESLLIFFSPLTSCSITSVSLSVRNLTSTSAPEVGSVNLRVPLDVIASSLNGLFSKEDKSTSYDLPSIVNEYSLPYP